MPRRRVDPGVGAQALARCRASTQPDLGDVPRAVVATAVRYSLEELSLTHPGRSVEVRVPPFGAVQCVAGPTHRRGTPPTVIETDPATWLGVAVGSIGFTAAMADGRLQASGERADLSGVLPLETLRVER